MYRLATNVHWLRSELFFSEVFYPAIEVYVWSADACACSLGFLVVEQAFEFYLTYRQRRCLKKDSPPSELLKQAKVIDDMNVSKQPVPATSAAGEGKGEEQSPKESAFASFVSTIKEKFSKSKDYNLDKNLFSFISSSYNLTLAISSLMVGVTPYMWHLCKQLSKQICTLGVFGGLGGQSSLPGADNEFVISALFLVISSLIDTITSLPISYYSTFVLEEKHGFNKTTQW